MGWVVALTHSCCARGLVINTGAQKLQRHAVCLSWLQLGCGRDCNLPDRCSSTLDSHQVDQKGVMTAPLIRHVDQTVMVAAARQSADVVGD